MSCNPSVPLIHSIITMLVTSKGALNRENCQLHVNKLKDIVMRKLLSEFYSVHYDHVKPSLLKDLVNHSAVNVVFN